MKRIIRSSLCYLLCIASIHCWAKKKEAFTIPIPFSKDTLALIPISKKLHSFSIRDFTISPKEDELFFTIESNKNTIAAIIQMEKRNGKWKINIAPFSGKYYDLEASFAPDGNALYFSSNRPKNDSTSKQDFDIWKTEKRNGSWQLPVNLGTTINSDMDEFYPSVTNDGSIFFTAAYPHSKGKEDIWKSAFVDGIYTTPINLSDAVNSDKYEFNAFVLPDESAIVFTSCGRKDELGGCDLYISKKDKQGKWQMATNAGATINSSSLDFCPFVSADRRFFVFTSNRSKLKKSYPKQLNLDAFIQEIGQLQNGKNNLYWIAADAILQ